MTWKERLIGIPLAIVGALLLLATGAGMLLTRTDWGREQVRSFALEKLNAAIRGRVEIDAVLEGDLLRMVRFAGVRLYEPNGVEFARVDTLAVHYRWADFLVGNVMLPQVTLIGPVVNLRKSPEEDWNFLAIFRGQSEPDTAEARPEPRQPGSRRRVVLRDVTIRGGDVSLRLPWEPERDGEADTTRWYVERTDGGWQRVFRLERLNARLPNARVVAPQEQGRLFQIAQLSGIATVIGEPIELVQLRADLELHGDSLSFDIWEADLPASHLFGQGWVTLAGELQYDLTLRANPVATRDLVWLIPRLPAGVAELDFAMRSLDRGIEFQLQNADWESQDARLRGRFAVRLGEGGVGPEFRDVALDIARLNTALAGPLIGWQPPLEAVLSGTVALDGSMSALRVDADVLIETESADTLSRVKGVGTIHAATGALGASGLELEFAPLELALVRSFAPGLAVEGRLNGVANLDGSLPSGLAIQFDVEQRDRTLVPNRLSGRGTVAADGRSPTRLDFRARADPISLTTLARYYPAVPFRGDFRGDLRVAGGLDDLAVEVDLSGLGDSLQVRGNLQLAAIPPRYSGFVRGWRIRLPEFRRGLPISDLDFRVEGEGQGARLPELQARGQLDVFASFVGGVRVDSATAAVGVSGGRLTVDTSLVKGEFGELTIWGGLRLTDAAADSLFVELVADSLGALNPWLFPDYGPTGAPALAANGSEGVVGQEAPRVEGQARVSGRLVRESGRLALRGRLEGEGIGYRDWTAEGLEVESFEVGSPEGGVRAVGELTARGVGLGELRFEELRLRGGLVDTVTTLDFELAKPDASAQGRLRIGLGQTARTIGLDSLALQFGEGVWALAQPAQLRLEETGALAVEDFRLVSGGRRIALEGAIGVTGPATFSAQLGGVNLSDIDRLWPDSLGLAGQLRLDAQLSGRVRDPIVQGEFEIVDGQLFGVSFSSFRGTLAYQGSALALDASAWQDRTRLFRLHGTLPLELQLPRVELALPEREIDLRLEGDRVPLTLALLISDQIDDVTGHAGAAVRIGGTSETLNLEGPITLVDGSFRVVRTGIRYQALEGDLSFRGTTLTVEQARLRSSTGGRGVVTGTVDLLDLTNPRFDLQLTAQALPVYDQLDARAVVSGTTTLRGPYEEPEFTGAVSVVSGVLFVEEIGRQRRIVDPFKERLLLIDTIFGFDVAGRQRSPFMENLTMDLGLKVERDTWLRSEEMNVEIAGDLVARMQPGEELPRITGTLQAIRGEYRFLNKRFEVNEGTIEFVGSETVNPNLRIVALYTVRTQKRPIQIRLVIGGTLEDMTLTLESTTQPPIPESDLLSYLVFGRPSYELTRGSEESSLLGDITRGAPQALFGYALGSLLVGESGIAYIDVSRVEAGGAETEYRGGVGPALSATQVEVGWYLAPTVFVSVAQQLIGVVRPTVRLEWRLDDRLTIRGVTEPRFGSEGILAFEASGTDLEQSFGVFLFYGWAY